MTFVPGLFWLPIPFADAPNPADCPHHQCNYHPVTASGSAAGLVVVVVVVVLLVFLAVMLLRRHRRRRRATQPDG